MTSTKQQVRDVLCDSRRLTLHGDAVRIGREASTAQGIRGDDLFHGLCGVLKYPVQKPIDSQTQGRGGIKRGGIRLGGIGGIGRGVR